jgi:uncharacterized protein (TIGR00730 family)
MSDKEKKKFEKLDPKNPWRIFRILSEFVDGFETMSDLGPSVAFFGSAKDGPITDQYYELSLDIAKKISQAGFSIITGGSEGIMKAGNQGAFEAGGKSCGLCINIPEKETNKKYIHPEYLLNFRYFFIRKVMFVKYAQAFIVLPGGFGTLDEVFESLTLIQTNKIKHFPVFLVGKDYWKGLIDWLKETALKNKCIDENDLSFFHVTDDADEILSKIKKYTKGLSSYQNF